MTVLGITIPGPLLWALGGGAGVVGLIALIEIFQGNVSKAAKIAFGFLLVVAVFVAAMTQDWPATFLGKAGDAFMTSFQGG